MKRIIAAATALVVALAPGAAHAAEEVGCAQYREPILWAIDTSGLMYRYGGGTYEQCPGEPPRRLDSPEAWAFRQEPATVEMVAADARGDGVVKAGRDGSVHTFGTDFHGSLSGQPRSADIVDIAFAGGEGGYWLLAEDGTVHGFGHAPALGSDAGTGFVAIASTPTGRGYWTATADGRVFAHGDAPPLPGVSELALRGPIVGIESTSTGRGLTLAAADGGVFTVGDAAFFGSAAAVPLAAPVVDVEVTADGRGYWLASADGGVFAFGSAPSLRSPSAEGRGGRWAAFVSAG